MFHGIFIGYYFFFSGLFLMDFAWKIWGMSTPAAWINARVNEKILTGISLGLMQLEIRYMSVAFFLLTWDNCVNYFNNYLYIGHILPIFMIIIGLAMPARKSKTSKTSKQVNLEDETEEDLKKIA